VKKEKKKENQINKKKKSEMSIERLRISSLYLDWHGKPRRNAHRLVEMRLSATAGRKERVMVTAYPGDGVCINKIGSE
jgi:hypothetical protein